MPIAWPGTLPQLVDQNSFGFKVGETVIRSDMDIGPAKVRRRFTKSVDQITCSMTMTAAQWAIFYSFFDIDLAGGAGTFTFNDPITQVPSTFRFVTPPEVKPLGGINFVVSMQWEKLP